ncbi:hypothetical protein F1559_000297 [Cyanidiococcus yangmingshanensis]|uniref:Uncharacterized protein n=1 Tax=Cyanidiococcus yangmingshanensis TaxID=2690220 RepID=A0A7J7IRV3_9RHOD|nr:hypothetical protein F1559_000297 [Cyanidiococcus yangmingshanensis]
MSQWSSWHRSSRDNPSTLGNASFSTVGWVVPGQLSLRSQDGVLRRSVGGRRRQQTCWRMQTASPGSSPEENAPSSKIDLNESKEGEQKTSTELNEASETDQDVFLDRRTERRIRRRYVLTERGARPIWSPRSASPENQGVSGTRRTQTDRKAQTKPGSQLAMIRVLVLGANAAAQALAKELSSHPRVCGCYFVSETTDETSLEMMKKYASLLPLRGPLNEDEVLRVADWMLTDYVFQAPADDANDEGIRFADKEHLERALAQRQVTFVDDELSGLLLGNRKILEALFRARDTLDM